MTEKHMLIKYLASAFDYVNHVIIFLKDVMKYTLHSNTQNGKCKLVTLFEILGI